MFNNNNNVRIVKGDSGEVLPDILRMLILLATLAHITVKLIKDLTVGCIATISEALLTEAPFSIAFKNILI